MRPNAVKTILRLRRLDRDAAQRHSADAIALEDAAIKLRAQAEQTIAEELRFAVQTDQEPASYEVFVAWLLSGCVKLEGERLREADAVATAYRRREHLIDQQVGLAAVASIEATRLNIIRDRARKAEIAMLQEATLRRVQHYSAAADIVPCIRARTAVPNASKIPRDTRS